MICFVGSSFAVGATPLRCPDTGVCHVKDKVVNCALDGPQTLDMHFKLLYQSGRIENGHYKIKFSLVSLPNLTGHESDFVPLWCYYTTFESDANHYIYAIAEEQNFLQFSPIDFPKWKMDSCLGSSTDCLFENTTESGVTLYSPEQDTSVKNLITVTGRQGQIIIGDIYIKNLTNDPEKYIYIDSTSLNLSPSDNLKLGNVNDCKTLKSGQECKISYEFTYQEPETYIVRVRGYNPVIEQHYYSEIRISVN
ncbi:hypothetical protein D5R81_08695 [Parashewanella spongiae]|uniref:Uncharacterized protein n=1 Tax=Parashewanella spongiae TaxID=342950 RepID=A0A3A6UDS4_9GAMM|nr:hypothetical protein [Parashewanella spongiae]RJY16909.1 hypothetical protein D5R81_08695 [Parashewanella spongiae]